MTRRAVFVNPAPERVTPAKLRAELLAAGVPLPPAKPYEPLDCYYADTGSGRVFAVIIDADDDGLDGAVQHLVDMHEPDSPLPALKKAKNSAIDARTQQLIAAGFNWRGSTFSLSAAAQMNWTNLFIARQMLAFPLEVSTLGDGVYSVLDAAEMAAFYSNGLAYTKAIIDSGRELKLRVGDAQTVAELEAIIDAR